MNIRQQDQEPVTITDITITTNDNIKDISPIRISHSDINITISMNNNDDDVIIPISEDFYSTIANRKRLDEMQNKTLDHHIKKTIVKYFLSEYLPESNINIKTINAVLAKADCDAYYIKVQD